MPFWFSFAGNSLHQACFRRPDPCWMITADTLLPGSSHSEGR